jgi:hypothetical protein
MYCISVMSHDFRRTKAFSAADMVVAGVSVQVVDRTRSGTRSLRLPILA